MSRAGDLVAPRRAGKGVRAAGDGDVGRLPCQGVKEVLGALWQQIAAAKAEPVA